eukprot:Rmarinus@m.5793
MFTKIAAAFAVLATASAYDAGMRVIETGPGKIQYMTEDQVVGLIQKGVGFVDITNHSNLQPEGNIHNRSKFVYPEVGAQDELVREALKDLSLDRMVDTVSHLSSYYNRYFSSDTAVESAKWLRDQYASIAGDRKDISVSLYDHDWPQPSVVARIEGSDLADEVVVIGGHIDSINMFQPREGVAPGADDDASGSSTVLEIYRVFVENGFAPRRTIEFHGYAAEEVGLWGSMAIASDYQEAGVNVVGMMQIDMDMYSGADEPAITFITDHVDADLTDYCFGLCEAYADYKCDTAVCGYGCSDHFSWTRAGYPSAFPHEAGTPESNKKIHTPSDTLDNALPEHALPFARLGLSFAIEMTL